MNKETAFLRSRDVAYILDISPNDVLDLVHRRRLKANKKGKYWRFRLQDVTAYKSGDEQSGGSTMEEKRLTRLDREKQRKRNEVYAAALELFSKKGFYNVSMREIAKEADFAIGTVYYLFKNKEDLYKSMLMEKAHGIHKTLKEVLDSTGDPLTVLANYVTAKGSVFAENVETVRLYFAERQGASYNLKAGLDRDLQLLWSEVLEKLASLFKAGIRKRLFRKLDPHYMAVALEGLTNSFLFCWMEDTKAHPYEENVTLITDVFLQGVATKRDGGRRTNTKERDVVGVPSLEINCILPSVP